MPQTSTPENQATAWLQKQIQAAEDDFTISFKARYPLVWWATLIGPFVLTIAILGGVAAVAGVKWARRLVLTALATFFFFGRFVILGGHDSPGEVQKFFSPAQLALMILYMDLIVASLLVCHGGFLFKLPFVGPRILALVEDGRFILASHPWMKRATFVGLVAFVMFPLAATGSVGGSIFGRLLGMSRKAAFVAVALGSFLGCTAMYLGANLLNRYLDRDNPWLTIGGIAFVALLILLLNHRYRQLKRRMLSPRPSPTETGAP